MSPDRPVPPSVESISDALTALGVYAQIPSPDDLQRQATEAGGEPVLRAALANALYGAAIGTGMLAEAHMLQDCDGTERQLGLARHQALRASGATGPGLVAVMHWQATHIAQPLRIWADNELGPLGAAATATATALMLILETFIGTDSSDQDPAHLPDTLDNVRKQLVAATGYLHSLYEEPLDLPSELTALLTAASDDVDPRDQHTGGYQPNRI